MFNEGTKLTLRAFGKSLGANVGEDQHRHGLDFNYRTASVTADLLIFGPDPDELRVADLPDANARKVEILCEEIECSPFANVRKADKSETSPIS